MTSTRPLSYAIAVAVVLIVAVIAGLALRDRGGTAVSPSPSPTANSTATFPPAAGIATSTPSASATASTASGVLDDRFGFVVLDNGAHVRSEASNAEVGSFTPQGRSFTSLSRIVSPDGRSVAYWSPVSNGAVLHVRAVTGGGDRAIFTGRPEMSGNAFAWSSDSTGLVAALDNNCEEICGAQGGQAVNELWTVDVASGTSEKVAEGKIWLPVTWDRDAKLVAAGVTGPGGYLSGYDAIDLHQKPYPVRSTEFRPTVLGSLSASADARFILSAVADSTGTKLAWWPLAEPTKRSTIDFDGATAAWRPGTSQVWWVGGLTPAGCRARACSGTQLSSFDVATGTRAVAFRGTVGAGLAGFRVDGSAAITVSDTSAPGANSGDLTFVELATGRTATVGITGIFAGSVRLRTD